MARATDAASHRIDEIRDWEADGFWGYVRTPADGPGGADVAAVALQRDGIRDVATWGGNFALVARSPGTGLVALIRDAIGTVPLYWTPEGGQVHASADLADLVARLGHTEPNPDFVAAALGRQPWPEETWSPFRGIHRVRPGRALVVGPGSVEPHQAWEWQHFRPTRIRPDRLAPDEAVDRLESVLSTAVADAVTGQQVATHLSGGLDSGVVTAIAARYAPIVASYTWVPWPPSDPVLDEQRIVLDTAAALGLDPIGVAYGQPEAEWLASADPLVYPAWGYLTYEAATLPLARAAGATMILSGWGGDDYASAPVFRPESFLAAGDIAGLVQHARAVSRRLGLPPWHGWGFRRLVRPMYGPRVATTAGRALAWRLPYPPMRCEAWWAAAQRFGLSYRYPLLDGNVLRAACAMPMSFFAHDGYTRWGFRRIAETVLPASVAWNTDKTDLGRVRLLLDSDFAADEVARARRAHPELAPAYASWADGFAEHRDRLRHLDPGA